MLTKGIQIMKTVKPEPINLNKFKRVFLVHTTPALFKETIFHGKSLFDLLFSDSWFSVGEKQRNQWLNQLLQIEGKYLGISKKVMNMVIRPLVLAKLNPWDKQSEDILSWARGAITAKVDDMQFINQLPDGIAKIIWFTKFKKDNFSDIKEAWPVYKKLMLKNQCLFYQFCGKYEFCDDDKDDLLFYWSMIKPYLNRHLEKDGILSPDGIKYMELTVRGARNMSEFIEILMGFYKENDNLDFYDTGKKIELVAPIRDQYRGKGTLCRTRLFRFGNNYFMVKVTKNIIKFVDDKLEGLLVMELKDVLKKLREKDKDLKRRAEENRSDMSKVKEQIAKVTKMLKSTSLGK